MSFEHDHEEQCFYCDLPLAPQHEHDHFPLPKRLGGEETVAVCWNCHTLKDRIPIGEWKTGAFEAVMDVWANVGPLGRIFLAKWLAVIAEINDKKAAAA